MYCVTIDFSFQFARLPHTLRHAIHAQNTINNAASSKRPHQVTEGVNSHEIGVCDDLLFSMLLYKVPPSPPNR
jgi:hypothetical protein